LIRALPLALHFPSGCAVYPATSQIAVFMVSRLIVREKKMPDIDLTIASGILVDVQQRLNCALLVVSSSLDFFRYRGLNSMS
jgi:hypothetical protein